MPLITKNIAENAEKCKAFVGVVIAELHKQEKNIMFNQLEALVKALTDVAPNTSDFEKVYGMKPFDYFMEDAGKKGIGS